MWNLFYLWLYIIDFLFLLDIKNKNVKLCVGLIRNNWKIYE